MKGRGGVDGRRPRILCVMRIPPSPTGHGGSQRAWLLVEALRKIGSVDFVLVQRDTDTDLQSVSLDPLRAHVNSVTVIPLRAWSTTKRSLRWLPYRLSVWVDAARIGSAEAPALGNATLRSIAGRLPAESWDILFAGRLPSAVIAGALADVGLIQCPVRLVDFDDIMSRFKERELAANLPKMGPMERWLHRIDIAMVRKAESRIAARWDAVGLCSDEDVELLALTQPSGHFVKVPNVVERPLLPFIERCATFRLLFVGNLSFPPNLSGLARFVDQAWPEILAARPDATLTVVGMSPPETLRQQLAGAGIALHSSVPSVEEYYREADAVICPILFGGGTRIKLLEAMAYGRPIVSTRIGAEGLELIDGKHALITEDIAGLAAAVIRLANEPELRHHLARQARTLQQERFSVGAIAEAVGAMIDGAQDRHREARA